MGKVKKSRYNWTYVKTHWEEVIHRLCEEVTPHDVLNEVCDYLNNVSKDCAAVGLNNSKFLKAKQLIEEGMKQINPTQE